MGKCYRLGILPGWHKGFGKRCGFANIGNRCGGDVCCVALGCILGIGVFGALATSGSALWFVAVRRGGASFGGLHHRCRATGLEQRRAIDTRCCDVEGASLAASHYLHRSQRVGDAYQCAIAAHQCKRQHLGLASCIASNGCSDSRIAPG